jgi:hypothetical protein
MVKDRQKGITKAYRNDKKDVNTRYHKYARVGVKLL